jgi:hypothetical protein
MAGGITFVFAYGRTDVAFSSVSSEVNLSGSQVDPRSLGARATATFVALWSVRILLGRSNIHRCVQCSEPDAYRQTHCPVGASCQGRRNSTKTVVHEVVSDLLTTVERP